MNFFKDKKNGTYLELGAVDGLFQSNTKFFEESLNWSGLLIEPHPDMFQKLSINRPNNFLYNNLINNSNEEINYVWIDGIEAVAGVQESLSNMHLHTYYDKEKNNFTHGNKLIKPITLSEVIKKSNLEHIDFMSLDVEGHEYEVLMSYDFKVPIDLILIETLDVNPEKEQMCRDILLNNGYRYQCKCALNEIYILKNSTLDK